ncbi:hypothetical protein GCM10012279_51090 [Micromonospora yangpuensis]|nr:hypothetical protein GCM10012279_51090 [Micromonospora yangpuensis]
MAKFGTGPKQRGTAAGSRLVGVVAAGAADSPVRAAGTLVVPRVSRSSQVCRSLRNMAMTLPGRGTGGPARRSAARPHVVVC